MRWAGPLVFLLLVGSVGCEDEPASTDASTSSPSGSSSHADRVPEPSSTHGDVPSLPRRLPVIEVDDPSEGPVGDRLALAHPAAFDLVATPPGATLVWAHDGTVSAARLSVQGEEQRRGEVAKARSVVELAAAATQDHLAVVWITEDDALVTASGTLEPLAFGALRPLGATAASAPTHARGRLVATATTDGRLMGFARVGDEPCQRYDEASCANFTILDLVEARARRRPGLEVPHPCKRPVVGYAVSGVHWHYAVCHHDGPTPTTVLFTAQQTPSYAQTNELLAGCNPRGIARHGDDLWLSGICGGVQRVVHVRKLTVTPGAFTPESAIRCADGELVIGAGLGETRVDEHTVGLGAALPVDIVPEGARAVWTGTRLLVARAHDDGLAVERHACREGILHPLPKL